MQGTLRAAVDKGTFNKPGCYFMDPALVVLLARDVAAAMLHLHRYVGRMLDQLCLREPVKVSVQ